MSPKTSQLARSRAKELRRTLTDAEVRLWYRLRRPFIVGVRFRRQVPIGPYIADFACLRPGIVIELDGGQHADAVTYDATPSAWLANAGFRVLRFWNHEVLARTDDVMDAIWLAVRDARQDPPSG